MKLQLLHHIDCPAIRKMWQAAECDIQPFCQYDYLSYIWKQVKYFSFYSPRLACVVSEQGEPLMILPLKWDRFKRSYKMLADIQGCGQTDAIFNRRLTEEERRECAAFFYVHIRKKCRLNRLPSSSVLLQTAQQARLNLHSRICVKIDFPQGVEALLSGLSKSVRQNLRTAYNRINRDGVDCKLQVCMGQEMTDETWSQLMKVYMGRLFTKHKTKARCNVLYRYIHYLKYYCIKHDTKSLRALPHSIHAILYGNGHIMGFMSGFLSQDGTQVVVPRLAIDAQYRFYSPGYVLLAETLRWLEANTKCRSLDLCRGDEQYKTDLGGEAYYTASVIYEP